jgi:hypothetical protein
MEEVLSDQPIRECCIDRLRRQRLPDISNHVGPVELFEQTSPFHLKESWSFAFFVFRLLGIDDHGSLVI